MANGVFDSPRRLVMLTFCGGLLSPMTFLALKILRGEQSLPVLCIAFFLAILGMAAVFWAPFQLRLGVRSERWPPEKVDPLRRLMEHPAWKVLSVLTVVALFVMLFIGKKAHFGFWPVFVVSQAVTQLQNAFVRPRPSGRPAPIDWTKVQPLRSDHWGER